MGLSVTIRLSVMMFLQFFIWGAWYVTAPLYLGKIGFTGADFGWTYSVGPIAAIISPFFVGMIADRLFATEKVLGVLHLLGGGAMLMAASKMQGADPSATTINLMFFAHMLCYFPTLALTNTLALHNMTNPEKEFPLIRVFGTIGWILAGWALSWQGWDSSVRMFALAGWAAVGMGVYSFFLPHTPPPGAGKQVTAREILGLDALVLFKRPAFMIFMVSSFLICIPLAFYYQLAARTVEQANLLPAFTMSWGQVSEIFFMVVMPIFFLRLGVKWMLLVGMLAWVLRYALFAVGAPDQVVWMIFTGVLLHGICYDFFFVTGQIYTDKVAPKEIRGQAQGMLVLFTLGLGMLIGAQLGGRVETKYTPKKVAQIQAEVGAIGASISATTAELVELMDIPTEATQFESVAKEAAKAFPAQEIERSWFENLFVVNHVVPLSGFLKQADKETAAIQKKIDEQYEVIAKIEPVTDHIIADLQEQADRLRNEDGTLTSGSDSVLAAIVAHLEGTKVTSTEAAQEVLSGLIDEKVEALNDTVTKMVAEDYGADNPALLNHAKIANLKVYGNIKSIEATRAMDWRMIYTIPAVGALVIMVLFGIFFHEEKEEPAPAGETAEPAAEETAEGH
jgi:nucleoside transporter